jgi:thioredoxin-like negative regulator of GroEL
LVCRGCSRENTAILDLPTLFRPDPDRNVEALKQESLSHPVVLFFTASWMGSAHILETYLKYEGVQFPQVHFYKIDIESSPELSKQAKIEKIPTVLILKTGNIVDAFTGLISKKKIRDRLRQYCTG